MKLVIIAARKPSLDTGADVRNYYLMKGLQQKFDTKIVVPSFSNIPFLNKNGEVILLYRLLFSMFGKIPYIEKLRKASFSKTDLEELYSADIIQIQEMEAYFTIEKYLKKIKAKIVLDTHNIDYIRFLAEVKSKKGFEKIVGKILAETLRKMEIDAIRKCDLILVCSKPEKAYFSEYISPNKICVIPNGAIPTPQKKITSDKKTILFMGHLGYLPNGEGLMFYIKHIHPQVLGVIPSAQLTILGKDAPSWLQDIAKGNPTIKLRGFVPSVKPYIQKATVCICPILSGSGTRLKVLEYMAVGKAVVSTTVGAEGLDVTNNKNILFADTANDFAQKTIELLINRKKNKSIGDSAQDFIRKTYDWHTISKKLVNVYNTI